MARKGIVMKIITTETGRVLNPAASRRAPKTNKFVALARTDKPDNAFNIVLPKEENQ
jgi:predicted ABC-class ATPase